MDYLTKRFDMIAERILENERLTADLDDEAAQVLLDWGLSSAKLIVDSTAGIEDEEEADEAMYTRLRANARLMRTVNKWVPARQTMDQLASLQEFGKVGQYVATVYAETFVAPRQAEWQAFLSSYQANNDVEMIVNLRNLFDRSARSVPVDEPTETEASSSDDFSRSSPPNPPETTEVVTTKQEPTQTDETPNEQLPASEPAQTDEPATDEAPSEQVPSEQPAPISEPATDEAPSEQVPSQESVQISQPATDETPTQQPPSQEATPISEPATDETPSTQMPSQEPTQIGSPVGRDDSKNDHLSGQAPTREQASSRSPNLQDSKPKSLARRLWNWTTSFFRKR